MKILKLIINILIAFFLTVIIIVDSIAIFAQNTILSEEYVLSKLDENAYYEKVKTDLDNEFENYLYQSGFPKEVFENLYVDENLKEDVNLVIDSLYKGTEVQINTNHISERLNYNINEYLEKEKIDLNDEEKNNIDIFESLVSELYSDKINFISRIC